MQAVAAIFSPAIFRTEFPVLPRGAVVSAHLQELHTQLKKVERDHCVGQKRPQEGDTLLQAGRNQEKGGNDCIVLLELRTLKKKKKLKPTNTINSTASHH